MANDVQRIPQFHLYGESLRSGEFDFVHVEPLPDRSARAGWVIEPHAHRHLHQITLVLERDGEVALDGEVVGFRAPTVVLTPSGVVHGFRFATDTPGHVLNFTDDVLAGVRDVYGTAADRMARLWTRPVLQFSSRQEIGRIAALFEALAEEEALGRDGMRTAQRAHLALLVIELSRALASEERFAAITLRRVDATVEALRGLIDARYRETRRLADYAASLGMTTDRLNEHCKRAAGVTAGHLLQQRVLTEAKRQLLFTDLSASEIAYELGFADPTHFSRFFKRCTGLSPSGFRAGKPLAGAAAAQGRVPLA
jgi:AraC family transcriptional activator of pobA